MLSRKKIVLFVFLTFAISSISYYVMVTERTGKTLGAFFMWSPGLAAILTQFIFKENLKDFGWRIGRLKYLTLGLALPLLYSSLIYGVVWLTGLGTFSPISPLKIFLYATVGILMACLAGLGEEIGWRGFLLPELAETKIRQSLACGTLAWCP